MGREIERKFPVNNTAILRALLELTNSDVLFSSKILRSIIRVKS
jgi:hypothetical protein